MKLWHPVARIERYDADILEYLAALPKAEAERLFYRENRPFDVSVHEGNLATNVGIALLLDLLRAAGGTAYNNANAAIGVGTGTTAASAADTNLSGASKLRKAMEATYPTRSNQTITFRSAFGSSDANFAWNEWGVFNNVTDGLGTMLNHKVESLGTKSSGATWTFTVDILVS